MNTPKASYSQWKAFVALLVASLRSIGKSPSSVIFTVAFPLAFIFGMSFLNPDAVRPTKIAIAQKELFSEQVLSSLQSDSLLELCYITPELLDSVLAGGEVRGVLFSDGQNYTWNVAGQSNLESEQALRIIRPHLEPYSSKIDIIASGKNPMQRIGFIITGQLGFSLLAASIFGVAFVFFSLRQQLVLKRFFATPIRRWNVLLAEGIARMIFQLAGAAFLLLAGIYFFHFEMAEGAYTFFKLMLLSAYAVLVFMSFGFIISGLAKAASTVPPLANIFVLPQFILSGTLFPIKEFPNWIQWISNTLPLTHLNNAMRKVAIQGVGIQDIWVELLILTVWGILGYATATRFFRWE